MSEAIDYSNTETQEQEVERNPIADFPGGHMPVNTQTPAAQAWEEVIDVVTYPVYIKELFFEHTVPEQEAPLIFSAGGSTNTGRDSEFHGVVVDRNRNGELSMISTVTGTYDTIPAAEIYRNFRDDLIAEGYPEARPTWVYVSGDGGKHLLRVTIPGMDWMTAKYNVALALTVDTSIDGTRKHSISLTPYDTKTGNLILGVGNESFTLSARHTKTIATRNAAFSTVITKMVKEWNHTIIPIMTLMDEVEFDKAQALQFLSDVLDYAEIGKRHADKLNASAEGAFVDAVKVSLLDLSMHASGYLTEALSGRQERLRALREKLDSAIRENLPGDM